MVPAEWPPFMASNPHFAAAIGYRLDTPTVIPSANTTAPIVAHLDVERIDARDERPLNYERRYVIETTDGRLLVSPPDKAVDYDHHRDVRPPFFGGPDEDA